VKFTNIVATRRMIKEVKLECRRVNVEDYSISKLVVVLSAEVTFDKVVADDYFYQI